jgi:hypothetical protein
MFIERKKMLAYNPVLKTVPLIAGSDGRSSAPPEATRGREREDLDQFFHSLEPAPSIPVSKVQRLKDSASLEPVGLVNT